MELFLNVFSSLLDAFILTVYLINALGRFKRDRIIWYLLSLTLIEVILYLNQLWSSSNPDSRAVWVAVVIISTLTTFIATLFFESKMLTRILASIIFQLLYIASESLFTFLILRFQPDLYYVEETNMLYATMSFGSVITMLFLILLLSLILKKNRIRYPMQFHIQLLCIPLITVIILSLLQVHSFYETKHINTYILLVLLLTIMNVINYIQIEWSARFLNDRQQLQDMQLLNNYQRQKYEQLSESYRSGRRFLHDTKNHFFVLQKYLHNKQYDQLEAYITHAFGDLENLYAKYNTGNLVIDSFMTSFDQMAERKNIRFEVELNIDKNRIPMEDYDLCIVLGNILDNALHACEYATKKDRFIHIVLETTKKDLFVIETENTMSSPVDKSPKSNDLEHGYGLKNINRTIEKYHGIMGYEAKESFHMLIRVPITNPEQRLFSTDHSPKAQNPT